MIHKQSLKKHSVCVLLYNNTIIEFGGWRTIDNGLSFHPIDLSNNNFNDIKWTEKYKYSLKGSVMNFGYPIFGSYIIKFGGSDDTSIFILNVSDNDDDDDDG